MGVRAGGIATVLLGLGLALAGAGAAAAQSACAADPAYPAPDEPGQVFYLQRSNNANTVVYAVRFDADGRIDKRDPVEAYWRRYAEDGRRMELRFLERRLAYGVSHRPAERDAERYRAHLVAHPAMEVLVERTAPGKARALLPIAGRPAVLECVYIELLSGAFIPEIGHIDVVGRALDGGERVVERLVVGGTPPVPSAGSGPETWPGR